MPNDRLGHQCCLCQVDICQHPSPLVAIVADTLLCHDDELDTRRIAFVLYLVPPWQADDGGSLDMFDMDGTSRPSALNLL